MDRSNGTDSESWALFDCTAAWPRAQRRLLDGRVDGEVVAWAVLIASGLMVLNRSQVARRVGVIAGAIGVISAIWWMPFYPVWSLTYVGVGGWWSTHS
jgi:hypothetical protein